jgi:hypothetical protein
MRFGIIQNHYLTGLENRTKEMFEKEKKHLSIESPFKAPSGEYGIDRQGSNGA